MLAPIYILPSFSDSKPDAVIYRAQPVEKTEKTFVVEVRSRPDVPARRERVLIKDGVHFASFEAARAHLFDSTTKRIEALERKLAEERENLSRFFTLSEQLHCKPATQYLHFR